MENKNIQPLNNNIEIEENKSFANNQTQSNTQQVYPENNYSNKLAEETNALLRQRLKKDIRDSISSMRKSMIRWGVLVSILFIFAGMSKSEGLIIFFFVLFIALFPIYFARKKKIINEFMDDKPIK